MNENRNKIIILDTETGGLDPTNNSITQLAMGVWSFEKGLEDLASWHIVEPIIQIDRRLIQQTKLALDNVLDLKSMQQCGMTPEQVVAGVSAFLTRNDMPSYGNIACGFNVGSFDLGFINRLYRLAGLDATPFSSRTICLNTLGLAKKLADPTNQCKLPDLARIGSSSLLEWANIQVDESERHTALGDVKLAAKFLTEFIYEL